jgi:hypothetical protein
LLNLEILDGFGSGVGPLVTMRIWLNAPRPQIPKLLEAHFEELILWFRHSLGALPVAELT